MARMRQRGSRGPQWPPDESWPEHLRVFRDEDWPASCRELALADWACARIAHLRTTAQRLAAVQRMTGAELSRGQADQR